MPSTRIKSHFRGNIFIQDHVGLAGSKTIIFSDTKPLLREVKGMKTYVISNETCFKTCKPLAPIRSAVTWLRMVSFSIYVRMRRTHFQVCSSSFDYTYAITLQLFGIYAEIFIFFG